MSIPFAENKTQRPAWPDPGGMQLAGVHVAKEVVAPYRDLIEYLLHEYVEGGHYSAAAALRGDEAVAHFCDFIHEHLCKNPPLSSGVVAGGFALVFSGGLTLPVAAYDTDTPVRTPGFSSNIGQRRGLIDRNMAAMPVDSTAVPVMTGRIGLDRER